MKEKQNISAPSRLGRCPFSNLVQKMIREEKTLHILCPFLPFSLPLQLLSLRFVIIRNWLVAWLNGYRSLAWQKESRTTNTRMRTTTRMRKMTRRASCLPAVNSKVRGILSSSETSSGSRMTFLCCRASLHGQARSEQAFRCIRLSETGCSSDCRQGSAKSKRAKRPMSQHAVWWRTKLVQEG